jgi:hypothetical protein
LARRKREGPIGRSTRSTVQVAGRTVQFQAVVLFIFERTVQAKRLKVGKTALYEALAAEGKTLTMEAPCR